MNFYQFYKIIESKNNEIEFNGEKMLFHNLSPNVQIQSGVGERDREYFSSIFDKSNVSKSDLEEFIHSYAEGWSASTGQSLGAKIIAYADGKVVIGKAPYHSYLSFYPDKPSVYAGNYSILEGYFNTKSKSIKISHAKSKLFTKIEIWKRILGSLLNSNLIDESWTITGCPPACEELQISVKDLLLQNHDINADSESDSLKEKETENIVQNFRTKQAIQNRDKDIMGYLYRYGENKK